jgi:hypothetical protein
MLGDYKPNTARKPLDFAAFVTIKVGLAFDSESVRNNLSVEHEQPVRERFHIAGWARPDDKNAAHSKP